MLSVNSTISRILVQPQVLSQYLSLTLGFVILISGTIGDCLNIFVFLICGYYKHNACCFYMLAGSLFDLLFLVVGLITRILSQGFNIDLTLMNGIWCKFRSSLLDMISYCSLTCLCLQTIDIFFVTSRSVAMRQRSNIKLARYILIGFIFLWIVHEIPSFVFQNLIYPNNTPTCQSTNAIYVLYHTYVATLLLSICVPITTISFFAFRIYQHLRSVTVRDQHFLSTLSQQMTRMALFQIGIVLLFQFPFGVATAYFTATTNLAKSSDRQLEDKLTQTFFNIYVYGLYSVRNS